jgi:hypothetical protein
MDLIMLVDIAYKIGVLLMMLSLSGGLYGGIYMLWKLMGAFRFMEFSEARRVHQPYVVDQSHVNAFPAKYPKAKDTEGGFVARTEMDSYIQEEATKVSVAAGISDDEAVGILLDQIRKQNETKGTVANV